MIYGDNPQKINEREDKLGLKTYSYAPQISAIVQSGNLYVYGLSNPVLFHDPTGEIAFFVITAIVGMAIGAIAGGLIAANNGTEWWKGALVGAGIGGVIGLGGGAIGAYSATGMATATFSDVMLSGTSWAAGVTVSAGSSSAIGRQFEKWFYEFYRVGKSAQQVAIKEIGRIDAFVNGYIYELKNYNWARYSSSQIHSVIKNFVEQASRYVQITHIGGDVVNGVIFYFSSKPPQEVIEALLKIGVSVQWVSTVQ